MKRKILILFLVVGGLYFLGRYSTTPPSDNVLINNFRINRAAYERLRDIYKQAVTHDVGGEARHSKGANEPQEMKFSVDHKNEIHTLLKKIGGNFVEFDSDYLYPAFCIRDVWRTGFADSSQGISVCWE